MPRIQIQDLPQNAKISAKEMERVFGGNGTPLPPVPFLGVSISPGRGGPVAYYDHPQAPLMGLDPGPGPIINGDSPGSGPAM